MGSNWSFEDKKENTSSLKVKIIGYGTFLLDAIRSLAAGKQPKVWGEDITILGPIKVIGYRRLWPEASYPIIQKANEYFFLGLIFEINETQLSRFDQIEGVPTLYKREMINMEFRSNTISVFIYTPSKKTLQYVLYEYERTGTEPGFDDWLEYLQGELSTEELRVFPEIFSI